ncbi:hypothetical protein ACSFV5_07805 [Acinetobacter sp. HC8-3S]
MKAEQLKELDSLHLVVMDAYKLFDRGSISINQIHLCPICDQYENDTLKYFVETPLKNIKYQVLLRRYGSGGCISNISLEEFKYFLPRFLDLLVEKNSNYHIDIFDIITNFGLDGWKQKEILFLNLFAQNYIQYILWNEEDTSIKYIQDILEMFQHELFETEILSKLCIEHPSSYSLIDYATQKVTGGYDDYLVENESLCHRIKQIVSIWNADKNIRQYFIDRYYELKKKGYTFDRGNSNYVLEWKKGVDQGIY